MNNILDYGAIGDGITVNTKAIQAAIDAGGAVYVPRGVFVTGTLHLKSGGGLYLEQGAVLKASHNREDYNEADYCPQNVAFLCESMIGTHLISAVEQENIFLAGTGTIDGESHFWVNESVMDRHGNFFAMPPIEKNRPGQMIFFAECKNVKVQGLTLRNAPFWHLFLHGCEQVQINGLSIFGERRQWTNDGIDIDCCRGVTVSDCIIDTGDDAITLRAYGAPLLHREAVCEDVAITNCILTSYLDYGIRIGVGDGLIRNCMISNTVIRNSLNGIGFTGRYSPSTRGVSFENIRLSGLTVEALNAFELCMSGRESHPPFAEHRYMRDVVFDGIVAYSKRISYLVGFDGATVSDVTFRNMKMYVSKEEPNNDRYRCNWIEVRDKKAAFYLCRTYKVRFENVTFCRSEGCDISCDIMCSDCENLQLINILSEYRN